MDITRRRVLGKSVVAVSAALAGCNGLLQRQDTEVSLVEDDNDTEGQDGSGEDNEPPEDEDGDGDSDDENTSSDEGDSTPEDEPSPNINVSVAVSPTDTIDIPGELTLDLTAENTGNANGEFQVTVKIDWDRYQNETLTFSDSVPAGERVSRTETVSINRGGEFILYVNGEQAAQINAESSGFTISSSGDDDDDEDDEEATVTVTATGNSTAA